MLLAWLSTRPIVVDRLAPSPPKEWLNGYLAHLTAQGYARGTLRKRANYLLDFAGHGRVVVGPRGPEPVLSARAVAAEVLAHQEAPEPHVEAAEVEDEAAVDEQGL